MGFKLHFFEASNYQKTIYTTLEYQIYLTLNYRRLILKIDIRYSWNITRHYILRWVIHSFNKIAFQRLILHYYINIHEFFQPSKFNSNNLIEPSKFLANVIHFLNVFLLLIIEFMSLPLFIFGSLKGRVV